MDKQQNTLTTTDKNALVAILHASGRNTGLVVDIRDDVSFVAPCHEGSVIESAVTRLSICGSVFTDYLITLLLDGRGYYFNTGPAERLIAADIKEQLCYLALDFESELQKSATHIDRTYYLPDGQVVTIGNERFKCPEALFSPSVGGNSEPGIHECIYNAIMKCDVNIRPELWSNVALAGSSSMFPGIADRLQKELCGLVPSTTKVKVLAPSARKNLSNIGAHVQNKV